MRLEYAVYLGCRLLGRWQVLYDPIHINELEALVAKWQRFGYTTNPVCNSLIDCNRIVWIETHNASNIVIEMEPTGARTRTEVQHHHARL
jgi:alpha-D-ribose 1-methylphosphonate 5-triphosphate synthase subunit PhnH